MIRTPKFHTIFIATLASVLAMPVMFADGGRDLQVDEQPLSDSLKSVASEFDVDIAFFTETTAGREGIALAGNYTQGQAFDALLGNTGLEYAQLDNGTVVVRTQGEGGSDSGEPQAPIEVRKQIESGIAMVTGVVMDVHSEIGLKGALVTIQDAGLATSTVITDGFGKFRFSNVAVGAYTVSVTFLGYVGQTAYVSVSDSDPAARHDFALRGGSDVEEIVVYGSRSSRALALNQELNAENSSSVLSADLLGNFTGTTLSDALRRVPGITFQQDGATGDGTNIIVRGLAPDFNLVTLNGLVLPESTGQLRSANLSNILADSVDTITVNKTLLPNHESAGTGGLVEIETKSPLSRPSRYANFGLEGIKRGKDFGEDFLATGTLSGHFGADEQFGLSASLQYRDQDISNRQYSLGMIFGQYLPLAEDGTPYTSFGQIDPRTSFPFESGVDKAFITSANNTTSRIQSDTLTVGLSAEWQLADHSNLRFDYLRADRSTESINTGARVSANPWPGLYPIDALGDELRWSYTVDGGIFGPAFEGIGIFSISPDLRYIPKDQNVTDTYALRGESVIDQWTFKYLAGYAEGANKEPRVLNASFQGSNFFPVVLAEELLPEAFDAELGRIPSYYAPRNGNGYPVPLFTDAGWARVNSPNMIGFSRASEGGFSGENERSTAEFSAKYELEDETLKYLEAGLDYERSSSARRSTPTLTNYSDINPLFASDLGLLTDFEPLALSEVSDSGQTFQVLSQAGAQDFLLNLDSIAATNPDLLASVFEFDPLSQNTSSQESDLAGYVQGRVDIDKLEIIGGWRLDRVKLDATIGNAPTIIDEFGVQDTAFADANRVLITESATESDILPRFLLNYRYSDRLIFRGGFFTSVARPQIRDLSDNQSLRLDLRPVYGPDANLPQLRITKGNPALGPAYTKNYDLGVEYYHKNIGVVKQNIFYKRIKNSIQSNSTDGFNLIDDVILPDDPRYADVRLNPDNYFISGSRPENSLDPEDIGGIETSIEHQFTSLPGVWDGLGLYVNHTYTDSSRLERVTWSGAPGGPQEVVLDDQPFPQQPKNSGTLGITYNRFNIDAGLYYSEQARRQLSAGLFSFEQNFSLREYSGELSSLDLRAEYNFELDNGSYRAYFEGNDLLKGSKDADSEILRGPYYTSGFFRGGRSFTLGVGGTF